MIEYWHVKSPPFGIYSNRLTASKIHILINCYQNYTIHGTTFPTVLLRSGEKRIKPLFYCLTDVLIYGLQVFAYYDLWSPSLPKSCFSP